MSDLFDKLGPDPPAVAPSHPLVSTVRADIERQLTRYRREVERRLHQLDPVQWAADRLGDTLWSGQQRILRSVCAHRRTAAMTSHAVGKSYVASLAAGWWLDTHPPGDAFVVTTAPTAPQVRVILWKEIGRVHTRGNFPGRVNQTEWISVVGKKEEVVAMGRKPSDYSPTAFQGIHAPYVLVIVDEANGVRGSLWHAIDSLLANDTSKILAIGNPDIASGEFYEYCKPGSGWNVVQFGAFETPAFTGEPIPAHIAQELVGRTYVEEKRRKWAPHWTWNADHTRCVPPDGETIEDSSSPLWQSKVLGIFPKISDEQALIPLDWIRAAQERTLDPDGPHELGQDVGGGGDASTIVERRGGVVRVLSEDHNPDTMQTCGKLIALLRQTGASKAKVDYIGIGRGVVDRAKELGKPVEGINVGEGSTDEAFENRRAELWWQVRERFEQGTIDIDPFDDDLAAELASIRFLRTSRGRIKIESKDDAKKRGVPSPNRADAVMLALATSRVVLHAPSGVGAEPSYWGRL